MKLSTILLLLIAFVACNKDEVDPVSNSLKLDGEAFAVNLAAIMGVSIGEDGHSAIIFSNGNEAKMKTLTIDVESYSRETIEGSYSYPLAEGDKRLDDWLTNYSEMEGTSYTMTNLEAGTVTVKNNGGDNYTLQMNLTMDNGLVFAGAYTGNFSVLFNNQ
jgi:hypothetical protein